MFIIDIGIEFTSSYNAIDVVNDVMNQICKNDRGGGCGDGIRDGQFEISANTEDEAEEIFQKVKKYLQHTYSITVNDSTQSRSYLSYYKEDEHIDSSY